MQTILDLKKELINSGWWDIDERISSDGWGNGKIGYTIWIRRPDWHGKAAFSLTGGSVKLHAACDDAFNEAKVIETLEKLKELAAQYGCHVSMLAAPLFGMGCVGFEYPCKSAPLY